MVRAVRLEPQSTNTFLKKFHWPSRKFQMSSKLSNIRASKLIIAHLGKAQLGIALLILAQLFATPQMHTVHNHNFHLNHATIVNCN